MKRVGVRELRQHASRYLASVKEGETVQITERGKLVALLVPPDPAETARDQLIAEGLLIPGRGTSRLPEPRQAHLRSEDVLDDLRADR